MLFRKPRIFLSYAREDHESALVIGGILRHRRFTVFVDSAEVLAGEDFVDRLVEELRRCDAVVTLLTAHSVASSWCQAEWYYAHAMGKRVVPIHLDPVVPDLPDPIRLLETRIHFLDLSQTGAASSPGGRAHNLGERLVQQLEEVRRSQRLRTARRVLGAAVIVSALAGGIAYLVQRSESFFRTRERAAVVDQITRSASPLSGEELARRAERFATDEELLGTVLRVGSDSHAADVSRLNAVMLSSELLKRRRQESRWFLEDIDWKSGLLDGAKIVDVTFRSGAIHRLNVRNGSLGGVYWGGAPSPGRSGLTVGGSTFENVDFNAGAFAGTSLINVDFVDCVFRGTELDVTNFGAVRFRQSGPDSRSPNLITDRAAYFENAVISTLAEPPTPGVLDLSTPEDGVKFDHIVFTGVRFEGYLRPDSFTNCSFDACILPPSLNVVALESRGNRVYGVTRSGAGD